MLNFKLLLLLSILLLIAVFTIILPKVQNYKLSSFYLWSKEDPLFTSPNFDTESLTETVKLLDSEQQALMKIYNLDKPFIPTKFLLSLSDVKKAENSFLNSPSMETARALLDQYKNTLALYREDIDANLRLLNEFFKNRNKKANIVYIDVSTTPQIILETYEKMAKNGQKLQKEIEARERCLLTGIGCIKPAKLFQPSQGITETQNTIQKEAVLDLDVLFSPDNIIWEDLNTLAGPFAVKTSCFGLNDDLSTPQRLFYVVENPLSRSLYVKNLPILFIKLASQNYYRTINKDRFEEKILFDQGIEWDFQHEALAYKCPDLAYQPKLATINFFTKIVKREPLFLSFKPTGIPQLDSQIIKGQDAEKALQKSQFPSFEQVKNLSDLYLSFYSKLEKEKIDQKNPFLQRGLIGERQLTDYRLLLNNIVKELANLKVNELLNESKPKEDNFLFLFIIRNAPSLTYITFSKSFWRLEEAPQFTQRKKVQTTGINYQYLKYTQAINYYPKEQILKWRPGEDYYNLLNKLYEQKTKF